MGIPRGSLNVAHSALKAKPPGRSCNLAVIKCIARAAVYKKHKGIFKAAEKDIKREGKHLGILLFRKKLHLLNEKDISKVLKKVIKGKIKNELVWDDLHRVIFCSNVGCARGGGPLGEATEGRPMDPLAQTSPLSAPSSGFPPLTMNEAKMGHTTPYNRHFDHVNAYLLSIAVQKLNKRSASLLSFLFSYLRESYRSMEPRHFLQIFLVLVKHTFRDVSVVHRVAQPPCSGNAEVELPPLGRDNPTSPALHTSSTSREQLFHRKDRDPPTERQHLHWTQMIRSEKNLLHVLTLHCAENINLFTLNDVAMTCEALCFFTLRDNPFVPFWNDVLSHVFGISSARWEVENTSVLLDYSLLKEKRLSSYVRRKIQRRGHTVDEVERNQTNGRRGELRELYAELSGRNMLSILKYLCLYTYLHAEVLIPVAKKAKKIFFEMPLDTTLHECIEIFSLFNSMKELEDKSTELRERIQFYEHQFGGTALVTQYDVKCLVTLAQLSFDKLHFVPFLSIFLNNVHKFSSEDAARLVHLLLVSWGAHTEEAASTGEAPCTEEGNNFPGDVFFPPYTSTCVSGLLATLLPASPEIVSQLTYTEMLLLCGAMDNYTLPKRSILKRVAKRICEDLKKVDLRNGHLPPVYIDYLFLITFTLYKKEEYYVNTNLLQFLVKIVLEKMEEDQLWLNQRRYLYSFYLLTLYREGSQGNAPLWVEYFNSVWGNLSPRLDEETLYNILLIYFEKAKQGDYQSLLRHLGGKGATGAGSITVGDVAPGGGGGGSCLGRYVSIKPSTEKCAKKSALMVVSPYERRFIYSEEQIKEELLKLFLHLWIAYPSRPGRKMFDLLIVMNAFSQDAYVRSYLFNAHVMNRINHYIAFLSRREISLTVHLCEDPVKKEPVHVNLSKVSHAYKQIVSKCRRVKELLATKTQSHIHEMDNATWDYILNDYKHKESVTIRRDAPQKGRPAKYVQNCRRGQPVLGALSAYGLQ
ncbi:Uncharacterized protein PCOAH_00005110 [Plasmodium coatneyi]|uniref:Uncharacterized protein n=1 Tax=Plasmodium coatneyi TaxID=208452 RepID=A0A1B1DTX3_9APIC|nr:Uncharacterized protein PCOAH_00005110 [Plasmodium coatneyi]ANQ06194.1 Uncharacterized protein PCOAH_00005110 [Plasmodium coatneyi]